MCTREHCRVQTCNTISIEAINKTSKALLAFLPPFLLSQASQVTITKGSEGCNGCVPTSRNAFVSELHETSSEGSFTAHGGLCGGAFKWLRRRTVPDLGMLELQIVLWDHCAAFTSYPGNIA